MSKFNNHKYTWFKPFGSVNHRWELVSVKGGIHFHASIYEDNVSCGLEFHSVEPRNYDAPSHIDCPITGGRCWHDGTSLYAQENLWPIIKVLLAGHDHESIFRILETEHDRYFNKEEI